MMGPPIHVQSGDRLKLTLQNDVPYTGISIHLHGLDFGGAFEYAGAVGVSQCPLAEGNTFVYDVVVNDSPGTYWYYTSSGHFGVEAYDAIRGPLIVHPEGSEELVDALHTSPLPLGHSPLAYDNERILFFQDGFLSSAATRYLQQIGRTFPPPSKSDEGIIVATAPWQFGTCNGKLRDVIHVTPNQKYKFRVINGGQHHALRFSIDSFPLTVVAADSQPIEAYTVDEIVLHVGERFDVEVLIYDGIDGERFWLRVDTLESQSQGFQNGVRAIMRVSDAQSIPLDEDVPDPLQSIVSPQSKYRDTKTLNCHSTTGCIPITALSPLGTNHAEAHNIQTEIHTVDFSFQPAPQYGHFVGIDHSAMSQNELPPAAMISRSFRPDKSVHPNSMALRVSRNSPIIIVWRTTLLMDVPMHIQGHSVQILDRAFPVLRRDCNLQSCRLSQAFDSEEKLKDLAKTPPDQVINKDTFVIPAGGAIVTRMHTGSRGLWMVNGQKDVHNEDGISFVLIVGDYRIPREDTSWPSDFPTCNTTLGLSTTMQPHCECYMDKSAPFQIGKPDRKFCSRSHLCRHKLSQATNNDQGFSIQSGWKGIPGGIVTTIFLLVVVASAVLVLVLSPTHSYSDEEPTSNKILRRLSPVGIGSRLPQRRKSIIDFNMSSLGSIQGLSAVASSHIGTVEHIYEEEEEDDSLFGADTPPPPPAERAIQVKNDDVESKSSGLPAPAPPPWRLNSQTSHNDLLRNRRSSTFDRIFSERGDDGEDNTTDLNDAFDFLLDGYQVKGKVDIARVDETVHRGSNFTQQLIFLFSHQWQSYFPTCVNTLRFVEVVGLACLTGGIFRATGRDSSQATVTELSSLVLVLTTTWTFSRLFFAIHSQNSWFKSARVIFRHQRFSLVPVFSARLTVLVLCESIFPTVATFICFPVAGLVGDIQSLCNISFLLASNNVCFLFLGAALGMFTSVSHGMIAATVFSQVSILVSGVFTELPASLEWARYFSPFFWCMQGLLKSVYRWSDTYECVNGSSSDVGANQCFVEYDPLIEQYKRRGLHVATYNDPSSDSILTESIVLVALGFSLHLIMFGRCFFTYYRVNWEDYLSFFSVIADLFG
ncbi:hypothetical protein ACHAXR_009429 [Thalassiosira sp. AJA248-18]